MSFTTEIKNEICSNDYSKLENMTDIPCYEKNPNTCEEYNETDLNSKEATEPYVINKTDNIFNSSRNRSQ